MLVPSIALVDVEATIAEKVNEVFEGSTVLTKVDINADSLTSKEVERERDRF